MSGSWHLAFALVAVIVLPLVGAGLVAFGCWLFDSDGSRRCAAYGYSAAGPITCRLPKGHSGMHEAQTTGTRPQ